jgi:hypothetical protein
MIDPKNITNYNRTVDQLQEFLMFAIVVAGKNSKIQAQKLDEFLDLICADYANDHGELPQDNFTALRWSVANLKLYDHLRAVRMGQYNRIGLAFTKLAGEMPDLKTITLQGLERIKGIGLKTSRFFLLHSFKGAKCAVLDTHVLKYLADCGFEVPKSTPQNPTTYRRLEKEFINMWLETAPRITLANFDLRVWKLYSKS